jgi:phenylacetate-CoA ligase
VQKKSDEITLRVVPNDGYNPAVTERLAGQLRERGADLSINIELVDEIPLTKGGKRRFVIREIG